ncbi:hypothetical protein B0H19DRAFT_1064941 [Mycena capillaripes]|nr:hypothetical protein B0H19DRAFT_1064941 [Mycena capillaripes]
MCPLGVLTRIGDGGGSKEGMSCHSVTPSSNATPTSKSPRRERNRELWEQVAEAQPAAKPSVKERMKCASEDTNWKPRDPRRGRSEVVLLDHKKKYTTPRGAFDNSQRYWSQNTDYLQYLLFLVLTTILPNSYPGEFVGFGKNAAMVITIIGQKFPGNPADLPVFSNNDSKVVLVSSPPKIYAIVDSQRIFESCPNNGKLRAYLIEQNGKVSNSFLLLQLSKHHKGHKAKSINFMAEALKEGHVDIET